MAEQIDPSEVPVVKEVELRLARPDERLRWDELMDLHHPLGFKQFAGRGLRYVAEWRGQWLALLGWQTGAFQCRPREQWLGWHKAVQFRRLHLIANNTRFVILPAGQGLNTHGRAQPPRRHETGEVPQAAGLPAAAIVAVSGGGCKIGFQSGGEGLAPRPRCLN